MTGVEFLIDYLDSARCNNYRDIVDLAVIGDVKHERNSIRCGKLKLVWDSDDCLDLLYGIHDTDFVCGGQWNHVLRHIQRISNICCSSHIELVVYFKGSGCNLRQRSWMFKQLAVRSNCEQLISRMSRFNSSKPPPSSLWIQPMCLQTALRMAFRQVGIQTASSIDDHRQEIIAFMRHHNFDGIIGQHADYVVFSPYRFFSSTHMKFFNDSIETVEYDINGIWQYLGLSQKDRCIFAALLGNHILQKDDLKDFYRLIRVDAYFDHDVFDKVSEFVLSFRKDSSISTIGKGAFKLAKVDVNDKIQRFSNSVHYYLNGTEKGFGNYFSSKFYVLPMNSVVPIETTHEVKMEQFDSCRNVFTSKQRKIEVVTLDDASSQSSLSSEKLSRIHSYIDNVDNTSDECDVEVIKTLEGHEYNAAHKQICSSDKVDYDDSVVNEQSKVLNRSNGNKHEGVPNYNSTALYPENTEQIIHDEVICLKTITNVGEIEPDICLLTSEDAVHAHTAISSTDLPTYEVDSDDSVNDVTVLDQLKKPSEMLVISDGESSRSVSPINIENDSIRTDYRSNSLEYDYLNVSADIMAVVYEKHQKGFIHPWIYQILVSKEIGIETAFEDIRSKNLTSSVEVYQQARSFIYSLLFDLNERHRVAEGHPSKIPKKALRVAIKEWRVSMSSSGVTNPGDYAGYNIAGLLSIDVPSIHDLWFNPSKKEWQMRAFLHIMRSDEDIMRNTSYVPHYLIILCSVLRYIVCNFQFPLLYENELDVFLATALSGLLNDIDTNNKLNIYSYDIRYVQLSSLFMRGVETAILANDACGSPIQWSMCCPWLYFDGKVFHDKCMRSKAGDRLIDLCGGHSDRSIIAERMREAILFNVDVTSAFRDLNPRKSSTSDYNPYLGLF